MPKPIRLPIFPRRVLWADPIVSVAVGAVRALGAAFVALQIVTVPVFAELEFIGLRRACAIVPV